MQPYSKALYIHVHKKLEPVMQGSTFQSTSMALIQSVPITTVSITCVHMYIVYSDDLTG